MSKKKLAYIISHGHTARGALQTGLLVKLAQHFKVVVISKESAVASLKDLEDSGIEIHGYHEEIRRIDANRTIFRSYIHQDIKSNPALWEKHLHRTNDKGKSWRQRLLSNIFFYVGIILRLIPGGKVAFKNLERNGYYKSSATELLKKIAPDFIISTRPVDDMEIFLLESARRLNIYRVFYILSWDNITSKGVFPVMANSYLTWGPIMNSELKEYYGPPDKDIYLTGVTHFDIHAHVRDGEIESSEVVIKIGLDKDKPFLFFTMSASYYAPNEIDIVEHLAKRVEENYFGDDMQLIIRPHMINLMADRSDQGWLKRLERLMTPRVKVDFPDADNSLLTWYMAKDDMIRLSTLLHQSSVCLNSGSTIAIEGIYLDKPVVITVFDTENWPFWNSARRLREFVHLKKLFTTGACDLVDSLEQMDVSVLSYLENPSRHQETRKKALELECFKNDGKATERFVNHMIEIASK